VVSLVAALRPSAAAAAKLADGARFSIDFADTPICFVHPAALRDAAACRGIDVTKLPPPERPPETEHLGWGVFRTPSGGGEGLGIIVVSRSAQRSSQPPDRELADTMAASMGEALSKKTGDAGTPVGPIEVRVVTNDGLPMLRTSIAFESAGPNDVVARRELLTVFGAEARYDVVWTGTVTDERHLRTLADAAVSRSVLAIADRPKGGSKIGDALKPVLLSVLTLVGLGAIVAAMKRRNPSPKA